MKNYKLISRLTLLVLLALNIIFSVMFFAGGANGSMEVAGDFLDIPRFTDLYLVWNYILVIFVCLTTLAVVIWRFVETLKVDKKGALTSLGVVCGAILLLILCWFLGSTDEVKIIGYEGTDNAGNWARLADASLYLTYILVCATICTLVWGVIHTKKLK